MQFHKNVNCPSRKDDLEVFQEGQFLWNSLQINRLSREVILQLSNRESKLRSAREGHPFEAHFDVGLSKGVLLDGRPSSFNFWLRMNVDLVQRNKE